MKDHEINQAIAEHCGSLYCDCAQGIIERHDMDGNYIGFEHCPNCNGGLKDPPDYCNDLNAMHEAELSLDPHVHAQFREHVCRVCSDEHGFNYAKAYSATARQRAEAFLRAAGKWKD